ncbi:MAG: MFS transporter, partial [Saprospiraceae bacterium]|nr:MFS transporter [Saprospiraceae bacterium]
MLPKKLNDKQTINGWAFFDWANSSYALVISVAIFPNYFIRMTDDFINVMGMQISNSSLYAFAISFAYLLIALMLPVLSGVADYSGRKLFFLKIFTTLGSISCAGLFFFKGMPQVGIALTFF